MIGHEQTPVDEVSGLPLLIVPDDRILPILHREQTACDPNGRVLADYNHAFHPAKWVKEPAVRNARVQLVMRGTHDAYHHAYSGPPLPATRSERLQAVVLCAAGYVPPQGLAFGSDGPRRVNLTMAERERLRTSGEVRVASFSIVQHYLKGAALAQPTDHIRPATIDRFLGLDSMITDEAKEQCYLAHLLLSLCIDRLEDPIDQPYRFGLEANLLRPDAPSRPGDLIHRTIVFSHKRVRSLVRELTEKLVKQRDGPEVVIRLGNLAVN
ncbi:MAG TPA: hypothetical protein VLH38_02050 [Patescibacteria group bacterium]|nr:hypothetical protein [Patescibacteria group bacterium]